MYYHLMRRLVITLAIIVSIASFTINLSMGGDFLHSAFMALCVLFASSIVIMISLQSISKVLFKHLEERRRAQHLAAERNRQHNVR